MKGIKLLFQVIEAIFISTHASMMRLIWSLPENLFLERLLSNKKNWKNVQNRKIEIAQNALSDVLFEKSCFQNFAVDVA